MRRHLLFTIAVLLVFHCFAWAKPVKLEYKFKPGEIDRYKMLVSTDTIVNKQTYKDAMKAVAVMKYKTISVNRDGSANMKLAVESMKFTMGGSTQDMDTSQMPVTDVIMTKFGEMKMPSGKGGAGSALMQNNPMMSGGMMNALRYPSKPIDVGKAWSITLPKPMKGKATFRLINTNSKVGKFTTAKLSTSMSGVLDMASIAGAAGMPSQKPVPITGSFSSYIAPNNGKLIRTDGNLRMKMQAPTPPPSASSGKPASKPSNVEMNVRMEMFLLP